MFLSVIVGLIIPEDIVDSPGRPAFPGASSRSSLSRHMADSMAIDTIEIVEAIGSVLDIFYLDLALYGPAILSDRHDRGIWSQE
jgi:hypothetical protein